jgi:C-terminal processing protease CtpA/Prc
MELSHEVGYIKVASFPGVQARIEESRIIHKFIRDVQGKNKKLILDLRRNSGGSPVYWEENLIRYFIKEPVNCVQYAGVKKKIFDRLEQPFLSSRRSMKRFYDSGTFRKVTRKDLPWTSLPEYFNDIDWYFFEINRTYMPLDGFDLKCQLYVLTDNDCFSATEDFVKTIKHLKLATLVGAPTCGGAAAFIEPWLFQLPNSKIIFTLEIELAFNPDGSINEIYGTSPDFALEPSAYPTTYPKGFSKEELLNDAWIQWVIRK